MRLIINLICTFILVMTISSCVSKKKMAAVQSDLDATKLELDNYGKRINEFKAKLATCENEKNKISTDLSGAENALRLREEQMKDLRDQINDIRTQRDKQLEQVEGLTTLSQSASENIKETLMQLEKKDKYIHLLQKAKTRTDSINLALAVNLKGVLSQGIEDEDVEVKVDKTVVFINLSDKMLFSSGKATLTPRAKEVLGKIARIIESRPELEVMVEGYTDNVPIKNDCLQDNWDLSVKRATSVVRVMQGDYKIDPNRLIAAGRGEYNVLADNATSEGRAINRRTRIIIMPKLDQFYDLLNPNSVPE